MKAKLKIDSKFYNFDNGEEVSSYTKSSYKNRGQALTHFFRQNSDCTEISCPEVGKLYRRENFIKDATAVAKPVKQGVVVNIPYIISDKGNLTFVAQGKSLSVSPKHTNYRAILDKVLMGDDNVMDLYNVANVIKQAHKDISIQNGRVYFNGTEVHNYVCDTIVKFAANNLPWASLGQFLTNLLNNPSFQSVNSLYRFLENKQLPITDDGCFIGWKRVNDNWKDFHTNKVDNRPGAKPSCPRNEVDDDLSVECSRGYHVGTRDYVFGFHRGEGHIVLCKVNPADVVAVPHADAEKVRVCKYEVIREMKEDEFLDELFEPEVDV